VVGVFSYLKNKKAFELLDCKKMVEVLLENGKDKLASSLIIQLPINVTPSQTHIIYLYIEHVRGRVGLESLYPETREQRLKANHWHNRAGHFIWEEEQGWSYQALLLGLVYTVVADDAVLEEVIY